MNKLYNTISCPCSSYAVSNSDGKVSCERDNFGKLEYVSAVTLMNHTINNLKPNVGDKWACGNGIKCGSNGFQWNTLHIVDVKESNDGNASSLINSSTSTENCYVPKSSFRDYQTGVELSEWESLTTQLDLDFNTDIIKTIDGVPMFDSPEAAKFYEFAINKNKQEISNYYDNGVLMYAPGKYYGNQGLISGVIVNGKDILPRIVSSGFTHTTNSSSSSKIVIPAQGGTLEIGIIGENTPIVEVKLKDSTGCSVFKRKKKNQAVTNGYTIKQVIPPLGIGKTQETYSIKIIPTAGVQYYLRGSATPITIGNVECKVWQFKNPTFNFDANNSTITNATTTSTSAAILGVVNARSFDITDFTPITHVTTITNSGGATNIFYNTKDNLVLSDLITDDGVIKKTIVNQPKKPHELVSRIQVADAGETGGEVKLEVGMQFTSSYEQTKILQKSIDLDTDKEPCDNCDKEVDILTNKFEFENTNDLVKGMGVTCVDSEGLDVFTEIESVDCAVGITLLDHYIILDGTNITFTHKPKGRIESLDNDIITLDSEMWFPRNAILTFNKGRNTGIKGTVRVDKSGSTTMTITTIIDSISFGQEDINFTLDVNEFVSLTPNGKDKAIVVERDSVGPIYYLAGDTDYNTKDKSVEVVKGPKNGTLDVISSTYAQYYPNTGFIGGDSIIFKSYTGSGDSIVYSAEKTISITVK